MNNNSQLLAKPIHGGPFRDGDYELASQPCVAMGLHSVRYLVIQRRSGLVVSMADDKQEALGIARRAIVAYYSHAANDEHTPRQFELWREEEMPPVLVTPSPSASTVSRRRREIHSRTHGRCFYCSTPLDILGQWHVEHQMPQALGGTNGALNLVPACSRCNLRKGARTAIEFMAGRGEDAI